MKLLRTLSLLLFLVIFCGITLLAAWSHQNKELYPTGKAALHWRPLVNPWRMNKDVVAYYSFQDEQLDKGQLRNRKTIFPTTKADFKFSQEPIPCRVVEGRWPGKQAVELDKGAIRLPPTGVDTETFALSFWIRHSGLGGVSGDNVGNAASIMAASSGAWHGWRIDLLFPSNRIVFNIARKRGQPTVAVVSALRIPPRTWTHIAVTREPTKIRIFVNGMLTGETQHDIEHLPLPQGSSLKLGYTGNGLSSAVVQFDDLLVLSSIPPMSFFLAQAQLQSNDQLPYMDQWEKITESFFARDYEKAIKQSQDIKKLLSESSLFRPWLDFRIGEAYSQLHKFDSALACYLDIRMNKNAPENIRMQALHEYLLLHEGVNDDSDSDFYSYKSAKNTEVVYSEIAPASYRYLNAMSDYDYYIPLNESKMQTVE
jgi:tetratricopeptide (TPR) repeat protein